MPGLPQCAAIVAMAGWLAVHGGYTTDSILLNPEDQKQIAAPREEFVLLRERMVREQLRARDIIDERVLKAMLKVPRHRFVPAGILSSAYDDNALPLKLGQTISQPYIVAFMTQSLGLKGHERVLEIGTGSGYQAAILAETAREVYTVEIIPELTASARGILDSLGYRNIHFRTGDGFEGWEEHAPFDAIVVTAAPEDVPPPLVQQLKPGGRMIIPVGVFNQELVVIEKTASGVSRRNSIPVRFVPMTGKARQR
jgi:protein-L-isoaspartate(D-aspartate) O-methyltransferase